MRFHLLGTAAGGGLPQWNCSCRVCAAARAGTIPRRTQSCAAISGDGKEWFLLNASPDLRQQIESFPPLAASRDSLRNSPIRGVLLNSSDLDHTIGLLLLREGGKRQVHATPAIRAALAPIEKLLDKFGGIEWSDPPLAASRLADGIDYHAIPLPRDRVAFRFTAGDRTIIYAPDVAELDNRLLDADVICFDGTFWSHDELPRANQMGHVPVPESVKFLAKSRAKRKIYIHINNTNPILLPDSPEHREVISAGIEIGADGIEI
jgi:pyrroloquinoline quinone biosynthesis protein B